MSSLEKLLSICKPNSEEFVESYLLNAVKVPGLTRYPDTGVQPAVGENFDLLLAKISNHN